MSRDLDALSCLECGGPYAGPAARTWTRIGLVVTAAATLGLAALAALWRVHGGAH
jgi:hypothetical protein